jgi:translation initiation factor 1
MSDRGNARPVYSTGGGRLCPTCGWPFDSAQGKPGGCKCSSSFGRDEAVPAKIVAKLRMEKKGRGGKTVTVVYGLPRNQAFLKELTQELKRTCGTGGAPTDEGVELQGDLRDRVRDYLLKKGYVVKG